MLTKKTNTCKQSYVQLSDETQDINIPCWYSDEITEKFNAFGMHRFSMPS